MAGLRTASVSYERLSIEISAVSIKDIDLKVSFNEEKFTVKFSAESLLEFLDRLRFAAESVVSDLNP